MKVHHGEGPAIHIGPEPCVGTREGVGEAWVGDGIGQPWSRESKIVSGADVVEITEGEMDGSVIAEAPTNPAWSETLACADALCAGIGRSRIWPAEEYPLVRIGKTRSRSR